jgi:hypothetical protein
VTSPSLTDILFRRSNTDLHKEAVEDLLKEISAVRKEVQKEYRWLQSFDKINDERSLLDQRRRLLHLFIRDLSSGVCGEMLAEKSQRDSLVASSKSRARLEGVSLRLKVFSWIIIVLTNLGMLFYLYLFASNQTHSRQAAWFKSFLMWLLFEVVVSSTGLVIVTHLLVPLLLLSDVTKLKEKVLCDLIKFRESYLSAFTDEEEGLILCEPAIDGEKSFNAAKFLFPSWRVASLFRRLPESVLILRFSTPWPKKKFGKIQAEVTSEYEQAIILTALSRIALYFVGSLLRFHVLLQDVIVQTICNSGFGFLGVLLIRLYGIHPLLPGAAVVLLCLTLTCLLKMLSRSNNQMIEKLASVRPSQVQEHLSSNMRLSHLEQGVEGAVNTIVLSPQLSPTPPLNTTNIDLHTQDRVSSGRNEDPNDLLDCNESNSSDLSESNSSDLSESNSSDLSKSNSSDQSINWSDLSSDLRSESSDESKTSTN